MSQTLVHQLRHWAATKPNEPSLHGKIDGRWVHKTWEQYWVEAQQFGEGLISLGHESTECVAIVAENRMEWVIAELGIMAAHGIPAPIYTTNTAEQMAYIVDNSKARIAICDGQEQYDKYQRAIAEGLMQVDHIITMDDLGIEAEGVHTFSEVVALGGVDGMQNLGRRVDELTEEDTGLLIYTSGTTGKPKGVMLEQGGMVEVAAAVMNRTPAFDRGDIEYRTVSYLPLCHAAEQLLTTMGHLATGGKVFFCPDIKGIKDYLTEVRPTVFLGVPRVWEKFEAALSAKLGEATGAKASLLAWARKVELNAVRRGGGNGPLRMLANKLVLSKVRAALGMDELYYAVTGSAPISVGTLEFFASLGVVVYEAYGMSETTGVCTVGRPGAPRFGRVGTALEGVEIRIADDGEVQLRGRIMTKGYLHLPEETAELYTDDGWLCTGDIGDLDSDGHLAITGRKKELLITAGGKNVAPVEMEAYMQQIFGVAQAVVVGDRQPYLSALVTIDVEALPELTKRFGGDESLESMARNTTFRDYLEAAIASDCNEKVARYQTIKKFKLLPNEFSVEGGELTPTMKLRRSVIVEKYASEIGEFYGGPPATT